MLTKKLARHGNSRASVIEKAILDLLGIDDNTMLHIHTDGESLIISPITAKGRHAAIRATGEKIAKRLPRAMQILAGTDKE